jgi:hypothetical protein
MPAVVTEEITQRADAEIGVGVDQIGVRIRKMVLPDRIELPRRAPKVQ